MHLSLSDEEINTTFTSTIGIDYRFCIIDYQGSKLEIQIWNCAVKKFWEIPPRYYRGADGILLVYDTTNRETFTNIQKWIDFIKRNQQQDDVVRMLIGNRSNSGANIVITTEQGQKFADENRMKFIETNVEENINIDLALMMVRDQKPW